ncbi:MAG: L-arabinose isomerase [Deltaproteobacteria bacterium]|jgi:L-arabinose isomerase|nr:L-arabinose isomerase [Deltaproteobacteria bacterium]
MSFTEKKPSIWLVAGSQHLYGQNALKQVEINARLVTEGLNALGLPFDIVYKTMATRSEEATAFCRQANFDPDCAGVITWMHTFSPAKMWTLGLRLLEKPMLQLHTQLGAHIPWDSIDMDFMNLHQTAHGGREFGYMSARLRKPFTVAVGHWKEDRVKTRLTDWMRVCAGLFESRSLKVARFGDNMRGVAVTEGDKVEAQIRFGYEVDAYSIGDLTASIAEVSDQQVEQLVSQYEDLYTLSEVAQKGGSKRQNVLDAARIEIGLRNFLEAGNYKAFTTNFQTLEGIKQLPGLAVQRLMASGYGFAGEGDWKTAALVRTLKVMAQGLPQGTSFMEDYTYDFEPGRDLTLGAHMLEVCPSLAGTKPVLDVIALGIGGKADPARLIFSSAPGEAINVGLMDMGNRFRLLINEVTVLTQPQPLPKLPVACAVWTYKPDFVTGVEGWIIAGGGHHTALSLALSSWHVCSLADELGVECVVIDQNTTIRDLQNELRWNESFYRT